MAEDPAQRFSWGWRMRCHMLERLSRAELNPEPYQPIYIRHATGGRLRVKIVPLLPCLSLSGFPRVVFNCTDPFTIVSRATNMSHFYSIEFNGTEGPTSGVEERTKSTASMFYQVLPTVVQSRMPMLPSIRHSLNDFRTRGMHSKQKSMSDMSLPGTPPPGYTSRSGSGATTPQQYTCLTGTSVLDPEDDGCDTRLAQTTHHLPTVAQEGSTGISWQHAKHGML
jgi:hypothetical protein